MMYNDLEIKFQILEYMGATMNSVVFTWIDHNGRVMLPSELRKKIGITQPYSKLSIALSSHRMVIKKAGCSICDTGNDLDEYKGHLICRQCLNQIYKGVFEKAEKQPENFAFPKGIIRATDDVFRLTLPKEYRDYLGINVEERTNARVQMQYSDGKIVVEKLGCMFCGSENIATEYGGIRLCYDCLSEIHS